MRSEGFPFIVWGSGGWTLVRLELLVGSPLRRRRRVGVASKQVVMSFCVTGVALCDIPTCLLTCRKCQNWPMSRTKISSCCAHVSRLKSLVEAANPPLFESFQAGCHVVLRGRCGTLWHSSLFDNVSKVSKLEEVSHEMLLFLRPRVSSRVSGFPMASPCLWGKLHALCKLCSTK